MNIEVLKKGIARCLATLSIYVKNLNTIHYFDINTTAEDFFKEFLNKIFGYNLININIVDMNSCAIDLADKDKKIAIQVTSDKSSDKIKYTIKKFIEKKLYEEYNQLYVLVITEKQKNYTIEFDTEGKFQFSKDNIIDNTDIMKKINEFEVDKLEETFNFLEKHFYIPYSQKNRISSNEVETIMDLIEFISNNKEKELLEIKDDYEPDPEYKIEKRFQNYSKTIKETYGILYAIYGESINNVESIMQLDRIKIELIQIFLKDISVRILRENENNPIVALELLVDYFEEELKKSGLNYDRMAIKGYIINQIIKCNVFPNEE